MNKTSVLMLMVSGVLACICGCGDSGTAVKTGFLGDYSKLQLVSDSSYRYIDKSVYGNYTGFIVDPVSVRFHAGGKAKEAIIEGKMTEQDIRDLANYFHSAIVKAISDAGYKIEYRSGPGIARFRVAITDLDKTNVVLASVPQSRLTGTGVGGAAMEAEVVDSMTGKQIAAIVETKAGSKIPFTGLSDWGGAKSAMDDWASRIKLRLEEARSK